MVETLRTSWPKGDRENRLAWAVRIARQCVLVSIMPCTKAIPLLAAVTGAAQEDLRSALHGAIHLSFLPPLLNESDLTADQRSLLPSALDALALGEGLVFVDEQTGGLKEKGHLLQLSAGPPSGAPAEAQQTGFCKLFARTKETLLSCGVMLHKQPVLRIDRRPNGRWKVQEGQAETALDIWADARKAISTEGAMLIRSTLRPDGTVKKLYEVDLARGRAHVVVHTIETLLRLKIESLSPFTAEYGRPSGHAGRQRS